MPQANNYLSSKWDEQRAWKQLEGNFQVTHDGIIYPCRHYMWEDITTEDNEAIDYLCYEWDYGFIL